MTWSMVKPWPMSGRSSLPQRASGPSCDRSISRSPLDSRNSCTKVAIPWGEGEDDLIRANAAQVGLVPTKLFQPAGYTCIQENWPSIKEIQQNSTLCLAVCVMHDIALIDAAAA